MKKLLFNVFPVFLTWMLGHILLYVYLNRLIPYAAINLPAVILWIIIVFISHYKWSYFMGSRIYSIYVGMDDVRDHS